MTLPFHLCQPGAGASCGACCGLYNFRDRSRVALTDALNRRTDAIAAVPRDPAAFRTAARALRRFEEDPLFPPVRLCPLLGFVDEARTRVGCLAHPKVTGGIDLRDCGAYNAKTCESFECPSFLWLKPAQARLVRAACPDWYLYGLVITDVELVRSALHLVESELGEALDPDRIVEAPDALAAIAALFARKERAPTRTAEEEIFGRFAVDDLGEPVSRLFDYEALALRAAPEDDLLLCLGVAPIAAAELMQARAQIRGDIVAIARALSLAHAPSAAK